MPMMPEPAEAMTDILVCVLKSIAYKQRSLNDAEWLKSKPNLLHVTGIVVVLCKTAYCRCRKKYKHV